MTETPESKPSFRRLLKNRSLTLLWVGQLISQSGDYIFDVALLWYVLQTTGSTFLVGVTLAAELLPVPLLAPIAGVYVDRINRKTIMLASNIFQGIITLILTTLYLRGILTFPLLILLVFLLISGAQFMRPAATATIPRLASKTDLLAANSLFTISNSLNQLLGYGIGGIIIALFGISIPIIYDALTFFVAAGLFVFIARSFGEIPVSSITNGKDSFRASFREGISFIRGKRILLQIVVSAVLINFFGGAAQALLAPYVQISLHGDSTLFGFTLAAFSLGVVLGSIGVEKVNAREHVGFMIFLGIGTIGVAFGLLGVVNIAALALLLVFLTGLGSAVVNLPLATMIQVTVPGDLMGRVFTSLSALATMSQPPATLIAGGIAGYTTVNGAFELFGVLIVATTLLSAFLFKELRAAKY